MQSTKSPGKKSEPQASVSSMGAQGSAPRSAPSAWLRLAPRGSETGAARPPLFLPSTLHPRPARRDSGSRRALAPSPQRHSPRDQAGGSDRRWLAGRGGVSPPPPLGPEASPGYPDRPANRPQGRASPRAGIRGARGPVGSSARHCAQRKGHAGGRLRPPPEPPPGRGSGVKGRGSRGLCSVTADAYPPPQAPTPGDWPER